MGVNLVAFYLIGADFVACYVLVAPDKIPLVQIYITSNGNVSISGQWRRRFKGTTLIDQKLILPIGIEQRRIGDIVGKGKFQ